MTFDPSTLTGRMADIWNGTSGLSPEKEQEYRDYWQGNPPAPPPSNACVYRGVFLEQYIECPTCANKTVNLRLYGCQLHGQCVIGRDVGKIKGCLQPCESRLEPEAEVK